MTTTDPAARPSLGRRAVAYLDWKANPVLLRDLRLYMRGKTMLTAYFILLSILILGVIAYALVAGKHRLDGSGLLFFPTIVTALICGAFVPNLAGERFRSELSGRAIELALASPLSPGRLVRGKLMGAWCLCLLSVSMATPVMAAAYLLGGVNPVDMLGLVGGVLIAGAIMPLPSLYLATGVRKRGLGRIFSGLFFLATFIGMSYYASFLYSLFGGGSYVHDSDWFILLSLVIAGILIAQFLYCVTVSRLRGESEKRDAVPRISLAAAALLGGASAYLNVGFLFPPPGSGTALLTALVPTVFAFSWGVFILTRFNASRPRHIPGAWRGKPIRRFLLASGPEGLTACFMVAILFFLAAGIIGMTMMECHDRGCWTVCSMLLSNALFILYGLFAYHYVVYPFLKERPGPNLLANTICVVNIALILLAVFGMILTRVLMDVDISDNLILGTTPLGLFLAVMEYGSDTPEIVGIGVGTMLLLFVALLPAVFRRKRRPWEITEECCDAP